jgi:hypothetical protein
VVVVKAKYDALFGVIKIKKMGWLSMKVKIIMISFVFVMILSSLGAQGFYVEKENNETPKEETTNKITVNFGSLIVKGNEPLSYEVTFIFDPIDRYDINVGRGADVTAEVNYELSAPGWHDDARCYIKFQGTDIIDRRGAGEYETGTMSISKYFGPSESFTIIFYGEYTWWYGNDFVGEKYGSAYGETAPYEENKAPSKPVISGPKKGEKDESLQYSFTSTDENNDKISYNVKWGDGDEDRSGLMQEGVQYIKSHNYDSESTFTIKAQAKDEHGKESEWSEYTVKVTRSKNLEFSSNNILNKIIKINTRLGELISFYF